MSTIDASTIDGRIEIVNQIINKIASLDRKFFQYNDKTAYVFKKGTKLYMLNEYNGSDMDLNPKYEVKPKEWTHGGTLWGLTKDFRDFITTGNKSNGENGYGGLYSPHWGYKEESMEEIRELAKSLNYL